ncbi:MAG: hypothetical protein P1P89_04150 [Desulfobacterales bacterium]|nr:hypothetical protein [Desulfobacterales bacterium]
MRRKKTFFFYVNLKKAGSVQKKAFDANKLSINIFGVIVEFQFKNSQDSTALKERSTRRSACPGPDIPLMFK